MKTCLPGCGLWGLFWKTSQQEVALSDLPFIKADHTVENELKGLKLEGHLEGYYIIQTRDGSVLM